MISCIWAKDHPRMRGEKVTEVNAEAADLGSPPHARGKGIHQSTVGKMLRITPACAGKSQKISRFCRQSLDHPRMRGEKGTALGARPTRTGSPPHARGKGQCLIQSSQENRITPACAGKSVCQAAHVLKLRDHPRMRGEKTKRSLSYANSFDPLIKIHSV